jgi:hypothetical protein
MSALIRERGGRGRRGRARRAPLIICSLFFPDMSVEMSVEFRVQVQGGKGNGFAIKRNEFSCRISLISNPFGFHRIIC